MIDTVVLRLHDLDIHKDIYSYLCQASANSTAKKRRHTPFQNVADLNAEMVRDVVHYGDSGKELMLSVRDYIQSPSSHYFVLYSINEVRGFIEFNFSVPKYLYGQNVAQFIFDQRQRDFSFGRDKEWKEQKKYSWTLFQNFIIKFFNDNFPLYFIEYGLLEINRIDLCYNQIFPSETEAKRYLSYQKKLRLQNTRLNSNYHNHDSSLMYTGRNYSVKIYHKGPEFVKNDLKELVKVNERLIKKYMPDELRNDPYVNVNFYGDRKVVNTEITLKEFQKRKDFYRNQIKMPLVDIDYLQNLANKVLRYEMTFRKNEIGKLFKDHSFRFFDSGYKQSMIYFKRLWGSSSSGTNLNVIPREDVRFFKYMLKWQRKCLDCYFRNNKDAGFLYFGGVRNLNKINRYSLDEKTFYSMNDVFRKFILNFQVKKMDQSDLFSEKIRKYNEWVEDERKKWKGLEGTDIYKRNKNKIPRKLSESRMKYYYAILKRFGSWDNVRRSGEIPDRNTFYRIVRDFKKIGYDKTYVSTQDFVVSTDYELYLLELNKNSKKLKLRVR